MRGADLFLTGGDEEELWLIESDGKEVAVDLVTETAAQTTLMAAAGGAIDFQRVGRTVVEGLPTAVRSRLLRAGTASWELVVKAWMEQYLALLDILLEVKKDTGADRLMRHRERLVAAELKEPSSRARCH